MKSVIFGITLISLSFSFVQLKSQSISKKGFIILNDGDTLYGWIDYRNWTKNPTSIRFRDEPDGSRYRTIDKSEIQFVDVDGLDRYVRAIITRDVRPVTMNNLIPLSETRIQEDTVLLRILVKSTLYDLFELRDEKAHFFIKSAEGPIDELNYKIGISSDNSTMQTVKGYINQLKKLALEASLSPEWIKKKIDVADYKEKDLVNIVRELNHASGAVEFISGTPVKKMLVSFFAGAGAGYGRLKFRGDMEFLNDMRFSGSFIPLITTGVEFSSARNLQDLVFRVEVNFFKASYNGEKTTSGYNSSFSVSQTNVLPVFYLMYNFIRNENVKVYIGGGIGWNFSVMGKDLFVIRYNNGNKFEKSNYLFDNKIWGAPSFTAGFKLRERIGFDIHGSIQGTISQYQNSTLTPQIFTGNFRYYF